jgi:beta-lactam-binding protein with PASTA domain
MGALGTMGEDVTQVLRPGERTDMRDSLRGESPRDDERAGKRAGKRHWGRWITAIVILLLLAAAGIAYALDMFSSGNASLKPVPGVIGLSKAMAVNKLESAGFKVELHNGYSDTVIVGYVVKQVPGGATELASGGRVDIWISRGGATVNLVDCAGYSRDAMIAYLKTYGLKGKEMRVASATETKGEVFKQDPVAGTKVKRGSTVTYYISTGPPPVQVPDLSFLTQAAAQAKVLSAGLTVGVVSQLPSTTVPAGEVVSQTPKAGDEVDAGSSVDIVISIGSSSPTPTPSGSVFPM